MLQCNLKKWNAQLERNAQKAEPWRRKQYRKARYRRRSLRYQISAEIDYSMMTMDEPWNWKYHEIWVI